MHLVTEKREYSVYSGEKDTLCYLYGNSDMIRNAYDILTEQGVPSENLHADIYF